MDIEATVQDNIAIVRIIGFLDTRASSDFEHKMVELVQGGARVFALDFTKVDMITSSGIRILMMIARRVGGADKLVLWGLNEEVKVVFSIAGLSGLFPMAENQAAAMAQARAAGPASATESSEISKMTRLAMRLLGDSGTAPLPRSAAAGATSEMSTHVARVLASRVKHRDGVEN